MGEKITKEKLEAIGAVLGKNRNSYFEYLAKRDKPSSLVLLTHYRNYKDRFKGLEFASLEQFYKDLERLGLVRIKEGRYDWIFHPRSVGQIALEEADELESIQMKVSVAKDATIQTDDPTQLAVKAKTNHEPDPQTKDKLPVYFQSSDGSVIHFFLPKNFKKADAERLKKLIDVYAISDSD
jgi:hypothetical protein